MFTRHLSESPKTGHRRRRLGIAPVAAALSVGLFCSAALAQYRVGNRSQQRASITQRLPDLAIQLGRAHQQVINAQRVRDLAQARLAAVRARTLRALRGSSRYESAQSALAHAHALYQAAQKKLTQRLQDNADYVRLVSEAARVEHRLARLHRLEYASRVRIKRLAKRRLRLREQAAAISEQATDPSGAIEQLQEKIVQAAQRLRDLQARHSRALAQNADVAQARKAVRSALAHYRSARVHLAGARLGYVTAANLYQARQRRYPYAYAGGFYGYYGYQGYGYGYGGGYGYPGYGYGGGGGNVIVLPGHGRMKNHHGSGAVGGGGGGAAGAGGRRPGEHPAPGGQQPAPQPRSGKHKSDVWSTTPDGGRARALDAAAVRGDRAVIDEGRREARPAEDALATPALVILDGS